MEYKILAQGGKVINNLDEVEVDVEYMYTYSDDKYEKTAFVTISKKNGEYVAYRQDRGLNYLLVLLTYPVYILTRMTKRALIEEAILTHTHIK